MAEAFSGLGESTVGDILLGDVDYVREAVVFERFGDELHAGAVDGGVDNLEVGVARDHVGAERKLLDSVKESLVDIGADDLDQFGISLELDLADVLDAVDVVDDVNVVRGDNLRAVGPVCLVSVVFLGVV